jgi:SAM-dependent methyltransferase
MPDLTELDLLTEAHPRGVRGEMLRVRVDVDLLQIHGIPLRIGENIKPYLVHLNLRRGRAERLTRRLHTFFAAIAAARVYRADGGWLAIEEIGKLDGWSRENGGSVAKLIANEFEIGGRHLGVIEQRGKGPEAQIRLRMPATHVEIGELPDSVRELFAPELQGAALDEDRQPQPMVENDPAFAVAHALRAASPGGPSLLVSPLYRGGRCSLVFGGLAIRRLDTTRGRPVASSVLVKVPIGLHPSNAVALHEKALDDEARLLGELAGAPGLPARVERLRLDLQPISDALARRHAITVRSDAREIHAMIIPLGHPRTVEAEPRLLSGVLDETTSPRRRLTRRNIHNVLLLAERLASLTHLLHARRRAHRHLTADAIVMRYELGIFEHILAADLAASVVTPVGSDDLLVRDLFDLGSVLIHAVTGRRPSADWRAFRPPSFPGREMIQDALEGESDAVAHFVFLVCHYLLEASPGAAASDASTVDVLEHFLDEIEHLRMVHWSKARGVPDRQRSSAGRTGFGGMAPRTGGPRSSADPVATRLVTIANLVDMSTLRDWCTRYITSYEWHASYAQPGDLHVARGQRGPDGALTPDACIAILQLGFGRSAAHEMRKCLWRAIEAGRIDERLAAVLRNYVTHWLREHRFDVVDGHGDPSSRRLGAELDELRARAEAWPAGKLLIDWIDELKRRVPGSRGTAGRNPKAVTDDRLRSWMYAWTLLRQLRDGHAPTDKEVHSIELALRAKNSPEAVFWHILLARAWVGTALDQASDWDASWDKAMRAIVMAVGVAASRQLPFEMAATLSASAYLTRQALAAPELRDALARQGADEDNVRIQAAECALMAADAYQWLDSQEPHYRALLHAAALLQGSPYPERLIQAFQLLALARNNRLLPWNPPELPDDALPEPSVDHQFIRYPAPATGTVERLTERERKLFDDTQRAWLTARSRIRTSDDPGTLVEHGYVSRTAPGYHHLLGAGELHIQIDDNRPGATIDRLLELARQHYGALGNRILDFGCGPGEDARHLARQGHQVWAVDSPMWFAAAARPSTEPGPVFLEWDPVDLAGRICRGAAPPGTPGEVDVVVFRCSLCRVTRRDELLAAAHKLLRPGGLVLATDWIQTRTTDRLTWSCLLDTMRFVDLETLPGYQLLTEGAGLTRFQAWDWRTVSPRSEPAMHRFFQRHLESTRALLAREHSDDRLSPHDRTFLLRAARDLEKLASLSQSSGPLGWMFWGAQKPGTAPCAPTQA